MRGETLKKAWVYGEIKDCQGRERKGRGWRGGWRVREEEQREKWMRGVHKKNIMYT